MKALTEALALELAADQILVNAIAPGPILAPPEMSKEESDAVVKSTPLGRWGGEEEIAKAVMFLVDSDFVDRRNHPRDGGRHVKWRRKLKRCKLAQPRRQSSQDVSGTVGRRHSTRIRRRRRG